MAVVAPSSSVVNPTSFKAAQVEDHRLYGWQWLLAFKYVMWPRVGRAFHTQDSTDPTSAAKLWIGAAYIFTAIVMHLVFTAIVMQRMLFSVRTI